MIPSLVFINSQDNKTGINEGALHVLNLLADLKANDKLSRKCSELNVTHLLELIMSSEKFHFYKIGANIFVEILNKVRSKLKFKSTNQSGNKKLSCPWSGPCVVLRKIDDIAYRVKRSPRKEANVYHIDRLSVYKERDVPAWIKILIEINGNRAVDA